MYFCVLSWRKPFFDKKKLSKVWVKIISCIDRLAEALRLTVPQRGDRCTPPVTQSGEAIAKIGKL
jgi:hypothetical protein